jgi:hypothetical protein
MIFAAIIQNASVLQAFLLHYIPVLLFVFATLMFVLSVRTQGVARYVGYGVVLMCLVGMYVLIV